MTDNRSAVCSNRDIEREPPETLRLVTAKRRERSAKLLSAAWNRQKSLPVAVHNHSFTPIYTPRRFIYMHIGL